MAQKYTALQKFAFGFAAVCAIAIIGKFVVSGGAAESVEQASGPDAEMVEIRLNRMAREFVLAGLRDPGSAQFRNQTGVCGEVNAKNSMGGYTGHRRFIATSEELVIIEGEGGLSPSDFQGLWDKACR